MPPKRLETLIAIGKLLAPKATRLAAQVAQAFDDPATYIADHADRMNERGIDEPGHDLPWIALIDALEQAHQLAEIDWKFGGEDIAFNLEQLAGLSKASVKWLRVLDEDDERSTEELLETCGQKLLADRQLQLAHLDMGSDSYCLVCLPVANAAALVALARTAKYGRAILFTGRGLTAAKREREGRAERDRKAATRAAKARPPEFVFYARGKSTWWIKPAKLAFDTGYGAPRVKYYANHYYPSAKRCAAAARAHVRAWKADGFRRITRVAFDKLAPATSAYIGWIGPFPKHGRYYLDNGNLVRCIALEGDALWTASGVIGKGFAELQNYTHFTTADLAAKEFAVAVARNDESAIYKPIERDALLKRYRSRRRS